MSVRITRSGGLLRNLILVLMALAGCLGERRNSAREEPTIETLVQGEPFEHTFTIPNPSSDTLVIRRVATIAGTITHVDSAIPPHGNGRITVHVETGPFLGVLNEAIKVEFADGRQPQRFRVQRRVVTPVEVDPQDHIYFFTARGEPARRELLIINHLPQALNVLEVTSTNPIFRPAFRTIESGRRYELIVVLDTAAPVGRHKGTIRVRTSVATQTPLIESLALIKDVVNTSLEELNYSRVDFNVLDRSAAAERTVLVQKYRGTDFRVIRAATDVPFLTVQVEPQKEGERYLVHVRIEQQRAVKGPFRGSLRIETNDPMARELKLPIHGEIL